MKRILMLSTHGYFDGDPSFGRADTGGQIVFVIELSKALARKGYKVDILTRQFEDREQIETVNEDVRIVRMPCSDNNFVPKEFLVNYLPELIDGFISYCKNNGLTYEFIDSHYWDAGYAGMKLASEFAVPHVFTPHSLGIWKEENTRKTMSDAGDVIDEQEFEATFNFKERNLIEKEIMQNANKIIATTPQQKSIIVDQYSIGKEKVSMIPPGFFPDKYYKMTKDEIKKGREKYHLPERFIICVGRIAENKGYDLLIKAFREVIDTVPVIKLVFAIGSNEKSDEEKRGKLAALAKDLNLSGNIVLLGYVKELEVLYNAAEILVMPSTYEPFGMVAIEGMACGTPAIITSLGGLKDFLSDGEEILFTDPLNTSGMAQTIIRLLNDKELREKIAAKGYEKACSTFTWEKIAESTLDLVSEW